MRRTHRGFTGTWSCFHGEHLTTDQEAGGSNRSYAGHRGAVKLGDMTEQPDLPPSFASTNDEQPGAPVVIGAQDANDVVKAFEEARAAGSLGVTDDPRWTGPDGYRHVVEDHDPGSREHHAEGTPHHH